MRIRNSLRFRVALGVSLLSIIMLSIFSLMVYLIVEHQMEKLINKVLLEETDLLARHYREDSTTTPPASRYISGYIVTDAATQAQLPPYLHNASEGVQEVFVDGNEMHLSMRRVGDARFYVVYDISQLEARSKRLVKILGAWLILAYGLSIWLGYWLAGLLVKPVSDLAQRVADLRPGQPPPNLADNYPDLEVKKLAKGFDSYIDKINALIAREQEFTANVSHELRTPLTAIKTSCELITQDRNLNPASSERVRKIDVAVDRMSELIKSLLFLAREDSVMEMEEVSVLDCAQEVLDQLRHEIDPDKVVVEVDIEPQATLQADRNALMLVLSNFLKNAVDNTPQGTIRIRYHDHVLVIEDTGRGIQEAEIPHVFRRFYRGGVAPARQDGFGLGLAIVKRLCDRYGWEVSLHSKVDVGTQVSLRFAD
jgi:signal transduction histidine kinase